MVAKITKSNSLYGTLVYNLQKIDGGEASVLGVNGMWESAAGEYRLADFTAAFKARLAVNNRTKKPVVHISLNPSPEDTLTDEQLLKVGHEYMQRMGFGEQPYVIFKHEDIERHHIHIVTTNLNPDGSKISDSHNFERSKEITDDMEHKYSLHRTGVKQNAEAWKPDKISLGKGKVRHQIKNIAKHLLDGYKFQTLNELKSALLLYGVDMQEVKGATSSGQLYSGVIYSATNEAGTRIAPPIKASSLGKEYGLPAIEKKIEKAAEALKGINKNGVRQILKSCMEQSVGRDELLQRLKESSIELLFRTNDAGRIYGVTVVDHNAKVIVNGSKLGREFSANAFHALFEQWAGEHPDAAASATAREAKSPAKEKEPEVGKGSGEVEMAPTKSSSEADGGERADGDGGNGGDAAIGNTDAGGIEAFDELASELAFAELLVGLFDVSVEPHREKNFVPEKDDEKRKKKKKKRRYI
ncbi:MAG: relaxase/mobilization nuclease domain-containing protein [Prevotellaceae bacterium]|jgi:hypothetical protein|nr:relaxase/mobilization nuclease domain-containing protein [Prevotellaceae bacterium]